MSHETHRWKALPMKLADINFVIGDQAGVMRGAVFYSCGLCGLVCVSNGRIFPGLPCKWADAKVEK